MRITRWVIAGALSCAFALPAPASACLNGVEPRVHDDSRDTRRAEQLLERGHLRRAFVLAGRTLDDVKRAPRGDRRRAALEPRLVRIVAVATVRLNGQVRRRGWSTPDGVAPALRRSNLEWAERALADGAAQGADPVAIALHGEALAAVGRHGEAARLLRPLAERDLMPDAYGYAALAQAERGAGSDEAATRATRACQAVAGRRGRAICDPTS